jgi:protein-S-isoprenylcysteine O-methyltransferase Ste14
MSEGIPGRLSAVARAALFASLFISLFTWFIPRWLAAGRPLGPEPRVLPLSLMIAGGLIMLRCIWDFAWTGRGTPAPFDPPRRLVIRGLYRWVRNPMYLGMGLFLLGEALLLPQITRGLLAVIAVAGVSVTLFVMVYEEPVLRGKFGADYETYCRHVRRWIPRLTPFDKASGAAVPSPDLD